MRTLVIGDIHGNHQALVECLERASFNNHNDQVIQIGDVLDGGSDPYECVETLLGIKNLIGLKGNHDDWFLEWLENGYHPGQWSYGGESTILSYSKRVNKQHLIKSTGWGFKIGLNPEDVPHSHRKFFLSQQLYHIDDKNRLFVHGGFDRHMNFFNQRKKNYYWDRELWIQALEWQTTSHHGFHCKPFETVTQFKEIFIGHTHTMHWNTDQPMRAANIINIDTGARHYGRLTIMDVDTKQFWQSDPISPT